MSRIYIPAAHLNTMLYMVQAGLSGWCLTHHRLDSYYCHGIRALMVIDAGCSVVVIANAYEASSCWSMGLDDY